MDELTFECILASNLDDHYEEPFSSEYIVIPGTHWDDVEEIIKFGRKYGFDIAIKKS